MRITYKYQYLSIYLAMPTPLPYTHTYTDFYMCVHTDPAMSTPSIPAVLATANPDRMPREVLPPHAYHLPFALGGQMQGP